MARNNLKKVDLLLSEFDKEQLANFIRTECSQNKQLRDRFLALGVGTFFCPEPKYYASRVEDLIDSYGGRNGFVKYNDSFNLNRDVMKILDEADTAVQNEQWDVAVAILTGVASVAEEIIYCGDDSAGELGSIVTNCFGQWHDLCANKFLPKKIHSEIFQLAISRFNEKDLKDWDWWWDWMEMAICLADTPAKQSMVFKALDGAEPKGDEWNSRTTVHNIQTYKLEMMSRCGTKEDQIKFMYDNVSNPSFRKRLIQAAWNNADYDEVLRLSIDGVNHDSEYSGLVNDWYEWQYRAYHKTGDRENQLQLARRFFLTGGRFGSSEYGTEAMYAAIKALIPADEWPKYVESLIDDASGPAASILLPFIFTAERMWNEYMDYIRTNPTIYNIDHAPLELKQLFRDELVQLYSAEINIFLAVASTRNAYRQGVEFLRNLIKLGGKNEAQQIVKEQKARTPRRPALIDELSKL